ncbi:hypothetical protein [Pseudomonas weihenstephanensis]|uniref:Phage-shock protein n=1 Tax=Pseudomonas weihenstephanensis TaxID=1608994 RepID=A0ABS1ZMJ3_9PSED|nr:hypothetical protein [Pseudomonas weihenstephanensis]MBM1197720.1 hypothetical protein [Pseudomonas weihenstephanensis]
MQIKRKAVTILRAIALVAAAVYLLLPDSGYKGLLLSIVWFCIGVSFSPMLPIWEKFPEMGSGTRGRD